MNLANWTLIRSNRKTLALAKTGQGQGQGEGMGKPESCELDANSLKSGRAGHRAGEFVRIRR